MRNRLGFWAATPDRFPALEIGFGGVALVLGLVSYAVLAGERVPAEGFSPPLVTLLLLANFLPLLALLLLIARRVAVLIANRRAQVAGAQLHVRMLALFAALAAAPTILVVIFASLLFQFGVQFWFSDRARTVLDNADRVAQAYVEENKSRILDDILAMGRDVSAYSQDFGISSPSFQDGLAFQVAARNLSEAAVFRPTPTGPEIIASDSFDQPPLASRTRQLDLSAIAQGQALVVASARDRVEAIVRLGTATPLYVYVSRRVEPRVLEQVARTQTALSDYEALTSRSKALQWRFNLMLLVISLLVVAVAIGFAIMLATKLVAPIAELADAAERVGAGDLNARVEYNGNDEAGALAQAFNRMTAQLKAQQSALIDANAQSDRRRRFSDAVLAGVSAGVLSIDSSNIIQLANASAEKLLECGPRGFVGRSLDEAVPEFAPLLATAKRDGVAAADILRPRDDGRETQTLAVRITADAGEPRSYILTFDDITQQLADQRRAAWSDIARRIAHEIKNPLTPIILSAERLKRRFAPVEPADRETFTGLTDTIVRQVKDLQQMVDEFSAFARMPSPSFQEEQLDEIARQALLLAEVGAPQIRFSLTVDPELPPFICDRRQMGQVFTNLLKNASEAVGEAGEGGEVQVEIGLREGNFTVSVSDTGIGLPLELRDRLFEPYVTTRQRGTGLGLAIVKRIVEDHHGRIDMRNREGGGAVARIIFDMTANQALPRAVDNMTESAGGTGGLEKVSD